MLTDDEARMLLHRAADTIEMGPAEPLPSVAPRPRWPLLVAAAVVLAVAVGSVVLTRNDNGDPTPAAPPAGEPVEQLEVLEPDQIPSVLGYDDEDAVELLEDLGLRVERREVREICQPPGIATGTEPSLGARFERGDAVRVYVTAEVQVIDCIGEPPWRHIWDLIRFARGLAGLPQMTEDLQLVTNDADPVTLSSGRAADRDAWTLCDDGECHSALAAIEQMATRSWTVNARRDTPRPYIEVRGGECRDLTGMPLRGSWSAEFWVAIPTDGVGIGCPMPSVAIALDPDTGRLSAVGLRALEPEESDVPPEPTTTQRQVADAFLAWARGVETPPPFADEVELLLADNQWKTVTAAEAVDRDRWSMSPPTGCSGLPPDKCELNPLRVIDEFDRTMYPHRMLASCGAPDPRHLPDHLDDAVDEELVALSEPEPRNCEVSFTVELWVTEEGRIRAVNVLP